MKINRKAMFILSMAGIASAAIQQVASYRDLASELVGSSIEYGLAQVSVEDELSDSSIIVEGSRTSSAIGSSRSSLSEEGSISEGDYFGSEASTPDLEEVNEVEVHAGDESDHAEERSWEVMPAGLVDAVPHPPQVAGRDSGELLLDYKLKELIIDLMRHDAAAYAIAEGYEIEDVVNEIMAHRKTFLGRFYLGPKALTEVIAGFMPKAKADEIKAAVDKIRAVVREFNNSNPMPEGEKGPVISRAHSEGGSPYDECDPHFPMRRLNTI